MFSIKSSTSNQFNLKTHKIGNLYPKLIDRQKDYKYVKKLEDGSFSRLYLVEDNSGLKVQKKIFKTKDWIKELVVLLYIKNKSERLLKCVDFYENYNYGYIITDFYGPMNLGSYLKAPVKEKLAKKIIRDMVMSLRDCHSLNVAHLDVKCENFVVSDSLVLIDFGHSEIVKDIRKIYNLGFRYGTTAYQCPEGHSKYFSCFSDIWSLGISAHYVLTNTFPFKGHSEKMYVKNVLRGECIISDAINDDAVSLIRSCLHIDPLKRPTAEQLMKHPFVC